MASLKFSSLLSNLSLLGAIFAGQFLANVPKSMAENGLETTHTEQTQISLETRSADWRSASFPVSNFEQYSSFFGYRPKAPGSSQVEFHTGLDMVAPMGSAVHSWLPGQVIEVSEDAVCGVGVTIQSGQWTHRYCHLQGTVIREANGTYLSDRSGGLQVWQGEWLQSGVAIGRVGMTGHTTGPHLHWEIKQGDQWVNPLLVLQAMYQQQQSSPQLVSHQSQ